MEQPIRLPAAARVPGSSANLGPGFDVLGVALELYLSARVEAAAAGAPLVRLRGAHVDGIATDESNLALRAFALAFERASRTAPRVAMELENEIPLARGLGSSGAAAVAGVLLANHCGSLQMTPQQIAALASELEGGHADNVAASVFGGLTVACYTSDGAGRSLTVLPLPWPEQVRLVVAIPDCRLSTEKARAVLPASYSRADAVFNLQRLALLVAALASGRAEPAQLSAALADRIHQPHRAPLVPGMEEALKLRLPGLLGVTLSGAGPSLLAWVHGDPRPAQEALRGIYSRLKIDCEVREMAVAGRGAFMV